MVNNYEAVIIVGPALEKEALDKVVDDIKTLISRHQGTVSQVQPWGKKKLAYPIKKQNEGSYFLFDFTLAPLQVKKIEGLLKLNEALLRTLVIKKES
ncbi:MAG: 30S ribosomal protein S6 [Candidatus Omnitrophica bacterium]|nr:30S ribosomal protein S6 [Candidatus Omnitrophota bacterium]